MTQKKKVWGIYLYSDTGCCEVMAYGCGYSIFRSMIYGGGSLLVHMLPLIDEIIYVLTWNRRWLYTIKELDIGSSWEWSCVDKEE